jgi:hypothetical protein
VPTNIPGCVARVSVASAESGGASSSFATPKSSTLTTPSGRTMTFSGLMSRWTIPAACAATSAPTTGTARSSASGTASAPRETRARSVSPSTHSIAT